MPTALLVIAPKVFRDEEYAEPKRILESADVHVTTASVAPGTCAGRFGLQAVADVGLDGVDGASFDAVVFVGGAGARRYFNDEAAQRIARDAVDADKVVGAICIAPSILANAGLLDRVRVASFASEEADLSAHGAIWTGRPVEVDGRIVTANGPEAATLFGEELVRMLGEVTASR